MTAILGISAYYHDSAAALILDGQIAAAAQEERFTRIKHDDRFPQQALQYCLEQAGLKINDLDYVVFYEKPLLKFERLLETYLAVAPAGFRSFTQSIPLWLKRKFSSNAICARISANSIADSLFSLNIMNRMPPVPFSLPPSRKLPF